MKTVRRRDVLYVDICNRMHTVIIYRIPPPFVAGLSLTISDALDDSATPQFETSQLEFLRDGRVEFESGTEPCACLALERHLQYTNFVF